MSHILFTLYTDDTTVFSAAEMNKPLEKFDEALVYAKNNIVTCDGEITANSITGNFSFTGALRAIFTSPIDGAVVENTVESALVKMELGDAICVDLNGINGVTLPMKKITLTAPGASLSAPNRILLAYRNSVSGEIYMANALCRPTAGGGGTPERSVILAAGVNAAAGNILCLGSDGKYHLADNTDMATTQDLVMVKSIGVEGVVVIESGLLVVPGAAFTVGAALFLGQAGNYSQAAPTESGRIVKCVGFAVEAGILKFRPDSFGLKLV